MNVTVFNYGFNKIRTITKNGEPWFILKDVCDVLGIINSRNVQDRLDEDEKANVCLMDVSSNGVQQRHNFTIINESGLYNVILRSDKTEARKFKRWITHEVLPSIRKNDSYERNSRQYIQALKRLIAIEEERERLRRKKDKSKKYFLHIKVDGEKKFSASIKEGAEVATGDSKLQMNGKDGLHFSLENSKIGAEKERIFLSMGQDGGLSVSLSNGSISLSNQNANINISSDSISISCGNSGLSVSSGGVDLSCGSSSVNVSGGSISINTGGSSIDVNSGSISLSSGSISTNPPVCKCSGGL